MTKEKRAATKRGRTKPKLTAKEKKFTKEYTKTLNGTQSALSAYETTNPNTAGSIANENLLKPKIRQEIERLLADNDIELTTILSIHRRNMLQDKHVATSQKAVNDAYELLGLKDQENTTKVNIAFIVEN